MSNVITIDLQVKGAAQLSTTLNRASQAISRFNQGSGSLGRNITAANSAASRSPGIFTKAVQDHQKLIAARASGDPLAILDAMDRYRRSSGAANKAYSKLYPSGNFGSAKASAKGGSDLGGLIGAQLSSPLGIAATAITALAAAAKAGSEAVKDFAARAAKLNTDAKGAGRATKYGDFFGEGFSSESVVAKLKEGGAAAADVARYTGYRAIDSYYSPVDEGVAIDKAVQAVRAARSDAEARRIANGLGAPELYNVRRLTDTQYSDLRNNFNEFNLDKQAQRDARSAELNRRLGAASEIGAGAVDGLKSYLNWVLSGFNAKAAGPRIGGMIPGTPGDQDKSQTQKLTDAVKENTAAVRQNTQTKDGTYGKGGPRSDRRSDAAASYKFFEEEARRTQIQLGGIKQ